MPPAATTLIFDVMGTVVDIDGSIAAEAGAVLTGREGTHAFVADWSARHGALMDEIVAGRAGWRSHEALRREALDAAVGAAGYELPPDSRERLATVVHRLEPWPDSPAALARLRELCTVVALSNADVAELVDLSAHGGLAWHGLLSAQAARSFKPHPSVYRMALEALAAEPSQVMLVAAHPGTCARRPSTGTRPPTSPAPARSRPNRATPSGCTRATCTSSRRCSRRDQGSARRTVRPIRRETRIAT